MRFPYIDDSLKFYFTLIIQKVDYRLTMMYLKKAQRGNRQSNKKIK